MHVVSTAGQTVPAFWLGIVLVSVVAIQLRLLPASGMSGWRSAPGVLK